MGVNDPTVFGFYRKEITVKQPCALLGATNNRLFAGDLYDITLGNFDINSDWYLKKKYNTIICTRCAWFAKDPADFIKRCHQSLYRNGRLYVDWGLGEHFCRDKDFKIGWRKNDQQDVIHYEIRTPDARQEYDSHLWSVVWSDIIMKHEQCKIFIEAIKKYGYNDLKEAVYEEFPVVLKLESIMSYFTFYVEILTITEPHLQMYILIKGTKR